MSAEETLHDVQIREQQLAAFILRSPEYRKRADQELKRQVTMLYLAIALLICFQGIFAFHSAGVLPTAEVLLITVTSILAIVNCLLLIQTKTWIRRLNEAWLGPQERVALHAIRNERSSLQLRIKNSPAEVENAALN